MKKKVLSVVLTVAMLASLLVVPTAAVSANRVDLQTLSFTESDSTPTEGNEISSVRPGDTFLVKVSFTSAETVSVGGFNVKLSYDKNVFETYQYTDGDEEQVGPISFAKAKNGGFASSWSGEKNLLTDGIAIWNKTGTSYKNLEPDGQMTLGYLLLKVKDDAENGSYDISFILNDNKNYIKKSDTSTLGNVNYSDGVSLTVVDGATPTVSKVELQPNSVTVDGTSPKTVQAKAFSAKGTDLTNSVRWSISGPDNSGVGITQNGTITVAPNAKEGEYTVWTNRASSGGGGGSGGSSGGSSGGVVRPQESGSATVPYAYATLTVYRAPSVAQSIVISADKSELEIPTGDTSATATFGATFYDQYGDEMTAPSVTWSIADEVNGVSIDNNGVVTVTKDAKNSIPDSKKFTITATSGSFSGSGKLTVKRATAQAEVINLDTVSDMIVPADGVDATEDVRATVKDQYGTPISKPTIEWSISPAVDGVSIDKTTGKITVTNAAKASITNTTGTEFTVTAKSGNATGTTTVTVKRAASNATSMKLFKDDAELTGTTDTVIIPSTSTDNTYTYSAKVYDQYGSKMSETATISFSATTATDEVTYADGTVTVKQGATKDSTYTLTVSYAGLESKTITITAKDIEIVWPTASKASGTYGDKWSDIVAFSGGSAKLNGTKVEGTFELKHASSVPDVGTTYQFVFKSTDGTYTVESDPQTADIAQKDLTITAGSASKQYDGQPLTKSDYTVDGLVNGDQATVTVTGSATNVADNGTNVPSNAVVKNGDAVKTGNYNITYVNGTLTITKAPLTIQAKDKSITYGDVAANDGATYTGLVNSEVGTTVAPVEYEYSYKQYDNVGEYVITPTGAEAANYDITYQPGKQTVNKKTVGLTWNNAENLYYDGEAKNVTATATELVNNDNISVTVVGGKETAVGNYTAKATALTGDKAGNYALPADVTKNYQIQAALSASDLTVTPATVTATIDGLTIKLVGYKDKDTTIEVKAGQTTAADNKLTVNGVEYTIDASGVKDIETSKIDVKDAVAKVEKAEGATIEDSVVATINNAATKAEGLNNALADLIARADQNMPEGATKVEVQVILNIQALSYTEGTSLKLNIKPQIKYTYKDANDSAVGEAKIVDVSNSDIKAPISISVNLPSSFEPNFAKHGSEWLTVETTSGVAAWQQSSFSEVELVSDTRTATVTFNFEDGHTQTITYGPADIGKAFPTDSKDGYRFNGWNIGDKVYTTLTDEVLTALAADATVTADFTKNNNGGNHGNSGSSGGVSTSPVSVTTPKNGKVSVNPSNAAKGATVTVTVTPDSGYEMDKLTVTDASGKTISTTDKGNGKFTFTMPNGKVSVTATFKQTSVTPSTGFVDVPASAYYANAVKWAVEQGITTGTSATTFSPEASCTRAQMVTFLWRAAGSPAPKATTTAFTDLDKSAYYYDAVLWAVEQGITTGTSATTFSPNATVTRGQTVTFLYRFAGQPAVSGSSSFADVNSSDYYAAAVQWAKEQGITSGTSTKTFSPKSNCTRGQIVTFLYRQLAK